MNGPVLSPRAALLLLAGCGDGLLDGVDVDPVALPDARAHVDPVGAEVTFHNTGGRLTGLALTAGEGIRVDGDLPDRLDRDAIVSVWVYPDVGTDRVIDTTLRLDADQGSLDVPVTGVVTPWVQVALEDRPDVTAALEAEFDAQEMVGLVVGVARGDTIVYLRGFGLAERAGNVAVDPDVTLFRWASLSKGLTGVVAAQLDAEGAWSLDDAVADHVDGYAVPDAVLPDGCASASCAVPLSPADRHVTVRDLLQHTGGMQHYDNGAVNPVPPIFLTDDPATNTGIAWALDYWVDAPLVAVPGTAYAYSTFGFNLAGVAAEDVLDVPFGDAVVARIGVPLSMRTLTLDKPWEDLPNRAVGYARIGNSVVSDGDNDVSWKAPGGGFLSTGADLTRYCAGLQGEVLMSAERRDDVLWAPSDVAGYGLGFGVGSTTVSHTGAQQKSRTAVAWIRPTDTCYTVMTNSTWVDPWDVVQVLDAAWSGARAALGPDPTPE